jgi:hypothetical protein
MLILLSVEVWLFIGDQDFVEFVGHSVLLSREVSVTVEPCCALEEQIFFAFEPGYNSSDFESQGIRCGGLPSLCQLQYLAGQ